MQFRLRVQQAAQPVSAYLEGVVVYTLSQQWDDLLSIYGLRLHPVPYCNSSGIECTEEAPAVEQFRYAGVLLFTSALLQCFAEVGPLPYRWHAWRSVWCRIGPRMIGMCLGWALGDACKAAFLATAQPSRRWRGSDVIPCTTPSCNLGNVGVASIATLVTAFAMLLTQPIASARLGCGTHACLLALTCYLRVLVLLAVNSLAVTVKILWTVTLTGFLTWGVTKEQQGTVLYERALMLWATTLAFAFAAATVVLRRWRDALERDDAPSATRGPPLLDCRALMSQYISLIESAFGWVVGCAFSDALVAYTPLERSPYREPTVVYVNVLVAAGFTGLGVLWLVASGQTVASGSAVGGGTTRSSQAAVGNGPPPEEEPRRSHVEAAYATNVFIFFVGWSWVVVLRDGTALVWIGVAEVTGARPRRIALLAEGGSAFVLGPALTIVTLWIQGKLRPFERLEGSLRGSSSANGSGREPTNPGFLI